MSGGKSARWVDEDMAEVITRRAVDFIKRKRQQPFFLYFATHDIHVPRVPHPRFRGTTRMGPRGDAIVEFDWSVGELLDALDETGVAENTLVILTSDNGPVLDDGYKDDAAQKIGEHRPAGPLRGKKSTVFEGGTRVPFIVRWPRRVRPGTSEALVCQIDFLASLATLVGQELSADTTPDGIDVLAALLGDSPDGRDFLVEQGRTLALRVDKWKLIFAGLAPPVSGELPADVDLRTGAQLYNLARDVGEKRNLAATNPNIVEQMADLFRDICSAGQSRALTVPNLD
jgi:arylsulfatase A-like enzyme